MIRYFTDCVKIRLDLEIQHSAIGVHNVQLHRVQIPVGFSGSVREKLKGCFLWKLLSVENNLHKLPLTWFSLIFLYGDFINYYVPRVVSERSKSSQGFCYSSKILSGKDATPLMFELMIISCNISKCIHLVVLSVGRTFPSRVT